MAQQTKASGWQLDEEGAAAYERNLVPPILEPTAAHLVDAVGPAAGARVLDVACGTGVVARHAAARVGPDGEVVGVDVSPAMLSVARDLSPAAGAPIHWKEASADDLPFPDASFDAALCQAGLQFFPDRRAALAELFRVVRPGGTLGLGLLRSVEHQPGYRLLAETLTRHVGVEASDILRSPYTLGDPDEIRALVAEAGFGEAHLRFLVLEVRFASAEALLRAETSSSPLGDLVGRLDPDVKARLIDDVTTALRPHTDDEGVVFGFQSIILTAAR